MVDALVEGYRDACQLFTDMSSAPRLARRRRSGGRSTTESAWTARFGGVGDARKAVAEVSREEEAVEEGATPGVLRVSWAEMRMTM